jgi:hypothetical protein
LARRDTHHLVVDFMEVNLTDFVDHVLVLVGDEAEASVSVRLLVEHQHRILDLKETVLNMIDLVWISYLLLN